MTWIADQWMQVRQGGVPAVRRKFRTALRLAKRAPHLLWEVPIFLLHAVWAVPAALAIRLVRPWLHVRVGGVEAPSIGHFIIDSALHYAHRSRELLDHRVLYMLWFHGAPANAQWARMVRREFTVFAWARYLDFYNRMFPFASLHKLPDTNESWDIRGILQSFPARFAFDPSEAKLAKNWLRKRGWTEGEPFVCFLVRDSAYLSHHYSGGAAEPWKYHDYRDSDIEAYADAMRALLDRGYWVIRMGKIMHKRAPLNHPRFIDYPFVDDQHDVVDIWLAAHCTFFVSTGTGIDIIPLLYGRPTVFVNYIPFKNIFCQCENICVPKHLSWKETGKALTLREHYENALLRTEEYDQAGVEIRDLGTSEITATVLECEARVAGTWTDTEEDAERQKRFWSTLRDISGFHERHDYVHPKASVGCSWLKSMGEAFFE